MTANLACSRRSVIGGGGGGGGQREKRRSKNEGGGGVWGESENEKECVPSLLVLVPSPFSARRLSRNHEFRAAPH